MAKWTSLGHAMRRRMGAPSNHLEAAGKTMARNHMTPEEVIASAEHKNSARRYMGMDAAKATPSAPSRGTQMPRKNTQAANPTAGGKANRVNMLNSKERMGARYTVSASAPSIAPEAGPTMQNAKIIPSVMGESKNFSGGNSAAY
jgi:hypothetical protein